ncbi:hypothetical protein PIB30_045998 [Stylosanthes scabra]|uniref:F-box domain-containing protein n=1 Tax=Stylosanthes scabra TaxID=79078 RepID=A0ABU6UF32_9FABA|nr:hypothetical protein [Stylosanthes scabra]
MASSWSSSLPRMDSKNLKGSTQPPNWLDLPREVTAMILQKLGAFDILMRIYPVCSVWRHIYEDPLMWRTLDMRILHTRHRRLTGHTLDKLCHRAVDRSNGLLEQIFLDQFVTADLLLHIVNRNHCIRVMRIKRCTISSEALIEAAKKLRFLEELELSLFDDLTCKSLEAVGRNCSGLRSLKLNKVLPTRSYHQSHEGNNSQAFAIAKYMGELRHLELLGNWLDGTSLVAILDGCPHLESLDLRGCRFTLTVSLRRRCSQRIKRVCFPDEHIHDEYFQALCMRT